MNETMREQELIVYKDFEENEGSLLYDMSWLMAHYKDEYYNQEDMAGLMYDCIHRLLEMAGNHGFYGNLWHCYLSNLLVNNENSYSKACEIRGAVEGTINKAVLHDIIIFKELFDYDFSDMVKTLCVDGFELITDYISSDSESKVYNSRIRERICSLAVKFTQDHTPEEMKETLTEFYKDYGVGKFGLHKAFRVVRDEEGVKIVPIQNIAHVYLGDLVGYEIPKRKLIENTEAFVEGRKANNCLLFGDAGTGKSSSIKGIANEYYEKGLRIIEVYKHQFQDLNDVITQIKNRFARWFAIYFPEYTEVFGDYEAQSSMLLLKKACTPEAIVELGAEKINQIWRDAKLRAVGMKRATTLCETAKRSIGLKKGSSAAKYEMKLLLEDYEYKKAQLDSVMEEIESLCKKDTRKRADACHQRYWSNHGSRISG